MTDSSRQDSLIEKRKLTCRTDQATDEGWIERRMFTVQERIQRTIKVSGFIFLAAFFSVFIPILHFVLVPLFLIGSLVFGIATWLDKAEILSGGFNCPQCKKSNNLERESETFPKSVRCQSCYFTVELVLE